MAKQRSNNRNGQDKNTNVKILIDILQKISI